MSTTATSPPGREYYRRLAHHAGLEFVSLDPSAGEAEFRPVNPLAARLLSEQVCRSFGMLAVSYRDGVVIVASSDPYDTVAREIAESVTGRDVRFAVAPPEEVQRAIEEAFSPLPASFAGTGFPGAAPAPETAAGVPVDAAGGVAEPFDTTAAVPVLLPGRIGDLLVERGLASEDQVADALEEQRRTGSRLGEVLVAKGVLDEHQLVAILAEQFQLPLVDLTDYAPDPAALGLVPEPLARHLRCVPIGVESGTLYLVVSDVLDDETVAALREHTNLELRGFLATRNSIDELLQRVFGGQYVATAKTELLARFPDECANRVLSNGQKVFFVLAAAIFVALLVVFPVPTLIGFITASSLFYVTASLYKFKLTYASLGHQYEIDVTDEEVGAMDERDLPTYSILVPLYREAAVVPALVAGIGGLDYPKTKLDVRLLCEEDDDETVPAIRELNLPPHFKLVVVPDAQPKTKPKACNYGLLQADGKYVVIYDAEDRPDPDQLKKIVMAFNKADPSVTCIQAKLNYFNQDQNLLTRWFSTEYAMWFDLLLPGLDASNAPIPLGGTSNHFVKDRLVELAAWDPFNVTEDADLGIRLHKAGYKTAMIDSTTLEEANSDLSNWINQRSRWIKGYIQTWLVHMRHPFRLLRQIGVPSWMSFQLVVGGTFIFLLNPIFWALTTAFFFTEAGLIQQLFPGFIFYAAAFQLFVGNFVFMYLNVAGSVQRGYYDLAKYALLSPLYWGLMSIAAWKGFLQLFYKPFYWEKTVHGLDQPAGSG